MNLGKPANIYRFNTMRKHTIQGNPFLGKYGDLLLLHSGKQVEISPKMRPDADNLKF